MSIFEEIVDGILKEMLDEVAHVPDPPAKTFFVIDKSTKTLAAVQDIVTALELMKERGRKAHVEDEYGTLLASMPPANTWAPSEENVLELS